MNKVKSLIKLLIKVAGHVFDVKVSLEKANTKKWMVTVDYKVMGITVMSETMPLTDFVKK